ncbi:MAG: aldo/keto reductase [Chloroflexota bacterium]
MDPFSLQQIGKTDLRVTRLGCGGATLGDAHGAISEAQASTTLEAAYAAGISYFDTAPWYGLGKSEHRFGTVLRTKPRGSFVISTKIGRVLRRPRRIAGFQQERWIGGLPLELRFDYTRDGVLRSYEDSLQRLSLNAVDALLIHDLDFSHFGTEEGVNTRLDELQKKGGFRALEELKRSGDIKAVGSGINHVGMIPRLLERFDLDMFIVAMPYTLLNQEALDTELPLCTARGTSVVIGAAFASGILARGPDDNPTYGYQPAQSEIVQRTRRIAAVCRAHGVPLGAAALQFPFGHPSVASIIPGPDHPSQVRSNLEWLRAPIPASLWTDLKAEKLIRQDAPTPG